MDRNLEKKLKKLYMLDRIEHLLNWDMEVYLKEPAIPFRAEMLQEVASWRHEEVTSKEFLVLVKEGLDRKDPEEQRLGQLLERIVEKESKLPSNLVEALTKQTVLANQAWKASREADDFSLFEKDLSLLVELSQEKAEKIGYAKEPYEALFSIYEPDLSLTEVDSTFEQVALYLQKTLPLLPKRRNLFDSTTFEGEKGCLLAEEIVSLFSSQPFIARSTHPFCTTIGIDDVRFTIRPSETHFFEVISTALHEMGHALYELHLPRKYGYTPLGSALSLSIHESQSKFFENQIGLHPKFLETIYPRMVSFFPQLAKWSPLEVSDELRSIQNTPIRLQADEATYPLHIILRYRLERRLINGSLKVSSLPSAFQQEQRSLLNIVGHSDREGVLQDCHWACGCFGYFPTYLLGVLIAAQLSEKCEQDLGSFDELLPKHEFKTICHWLKEHLHQWGSLYPLQQLLEKATGSSLQPDPFFRKIDHYYKK